MGPVNLTKSMKEALEIVAQRNGAGERVWSAQTNDSRGGIASGSMAALEERGLVTIEYGDRRLVSIRNVLLTDEGREVLAALRAQAEQVPTGVAR